jgi:hypothetical protein
MKRFAVPAGADSDGIARQALAAATGQPWLGFTAVLSVNAVLAASLLYLEWSHGIDHWNLVRDPNAIAGQPAYFGFYSNVGILAWAAAASIALFSWLALRRRMAGDGRLRALRLGGIFMALACLDDLFMLHEHSYLVGIPDKVVMAAYALFLLLFAASTLPVFGRTKWLLLGAALASFAISILLDRTEFPGSVLMEEVSKLTGISLLAAYLATLSWSLLSEAFDARGKTA